MMMMTMMKTGQGYCDGCVGCLALRLQGNFPRVWPSWFVAVMTYAPSDNNSIPDLETARCHYGEPCNSVVTGGRMLFLSPIQQKQSTERIRTESLQVKIVGLGLSHERSDVSSLMNTIHKRQACHTGTDVTLRPVRNEARKLTERTSGQSSGGFPLYWMILRISGS